MLLINLRGLGPEESRSTMIGDGAFERSWPLAMVLNSAIAD